MSIYICYLSLLGDQYTINKKQLMHAVDDKNKKQKKKEKEKKASY